ncbi:hypothetical protein EKO27_g4817 [Xylaria grammica]|uniref:Uncharacterized protein n=1 Tax=Xylaria grammica TaxID=363999 RepID=A0A439D782_9PEZI|nr:hypothetical protein EKO27_g4817 [Xylaria grammica]
MWRVHQVHIRQLFMFDPSTITIVLLRSIALLVYDNRNPSIPFEFGHDGRMASSQQLLRVLTLLIVACAYSVNAEDRSHYQYWYPQYSDYFTAIARNGCSLEIQRYQKGNELGFRFGCENTLTQVQCASAAVIACMLEKTTEDIKANIAAAAVVLGLLPTTLSLAGSSAAEAPAVSPIRAFEYREPIHMLREGTGGFTALFRLSGPWAMTLSGLQYVVVLGATANVIQVSWGLGTQAVISFSSDNPYQPLLWYLFALVIHIFGTITVRLRVRLQSDTGSSPRKAEWGGWSFIPSVWAKVRQEFKLSGHQPITILRIRKEMLMFYLFSWITSTGTIVHIIYGTLIFSGTLFVGTQDAILVVFRYFLSTVVCRVILMMEISGMRQSTKVLQELADENVPLVSRESDA